MENLKKKVILKITEDQTHGDGSGITERELLSGMPIEVDQMGNWNCFGSWAKLDTDGTGVYSDNVQGRTVKYRVTWEAM